MSKKECGVSKLEVKDTLEKGLEGTYNVYLAPVRQKIPDYIMLFQKALTLLREKRLSTSALVILNYFYEITGYGNTVPIRAETIIRDCQLTRKTVFKALKELKELEVIMIGKDMNDARINTYFINPVYAWKGTVKERSKRIKAIEDKRQLTLFGSKEQGIIDRQPELEAIQKELDAK
jgi:hypothetical protein